MGAAIWGADASTCLAYLLLTDRGKGDSECSFRARPKLETRIPKQAPNAQTTKIRNELSRLGHFPV